MRWSSVLALAAASTLIAYLYRPWEGGAIVGGWWLVLLGGRLILERTE